jgi:hypothetical protein
MNEQTLQRIENTLVVILKARHHPNEVGLLVLAVRWEPRPIENNNYYDENSLWELNIFLPAEAYARMNRSNFSDSEEIIKSTLNEITRAQCDFFTSVSFCPELVDELSFSQEQLIQWLAESLDRDTHKILSAAN